MKHTDHSNFFFKTSKTKMTGKGKKASPKKGSPNKGFAAKKAVPAAAKVEDVMDNLLKNLPLCNIKASVYGNRDIPEAQLPTPSSLKCDG